jgi:multiple sugar transport system permease protein
MRSPALLRKARDHAVMIALTLVYAAPILYMVIGSFKPSSEVLNGLAGFKPTHLSFDNYTGVVGRFDDDATGYFWQFYLTSAIVALVVVLGGLVVNSFAGYALARLRWPGRQGVLLAVIVPFEAIAVPLYYLLNDHRNTYYVQFLPFIASALSIYLFYSFFAGMPRDLRRQRESTERARSRSICGSSSRCPSRCSRR